MLTWAIVYLCKQSDGTPVALLLAAMLCDIAIMQAIFGGLTP